MSIGEIKQILWAASRSAEAAQGGLNEAHLNGERVRAMLAETKQTLEQVTGVLEAASVGLDLASWDITSALRGSDGHPRIAELYALMRRINNTEDREEIRGTLDWFRQIESDNELLGVQVATVTEQLKKNMELVSHFIEQINETANSL